jgi:hypothetical protein
VKRSRMALTFIGAWLLVMHWLDLSWLVLPELHRDRIHPHWLDLAAACAVAGLATVWGTWRYRHLGAWARGQQAAATSWEETA